MNTKNRNNLVRLVFINMLMLAYPQVSKTIHIHHHERIHQNYSSTICFELPEDKCPVCDFEFYNFVPSAQVSTFVERQIIPVCNTPAPQIGFLQFIKYFSLRAPPVA